MVTWRSKKHNVVAIYQVIRLSSGYGTRSLGVAMDENHIR